MHPTPPTALSKPHLALLYVITTALSLIILTLVLQLWRADFSTHWGYESRDLLATDDKLDPAGSGDALFIAALTKSIHDNGWVYQNNFLSMPGHVDLRDYPLPETLDYLLMKSLFLFTDNWALVINLFYLLTFPLTTLAALYALRQFALSPLSAAVAALLYTFLPYHFLRGEHHLALTAYFLVPLAITTIWWILTAESLFTRRPGQKLKFTIHPKGYLALLFLILLGSAGIYYSLFCFFFLVLAGAITGLRRRQWNPPLSAALLSAVLLTTLLANMSPTFIYQYRNGPNPAAIIRSPAESEYYALRIIQLLLPVRQHRFPPFADFTRNYDTNAPLVTENETISLGLIGSIGFLALLASLLGLGPRGPCRPTFRLLSILTLAALLLCTLGGFDSLLAFAVSPLIRSYCRIAIFIAFFALLAAMLLLERLREKIPALQKTAPYITLLAALLAFGLWDQTSPATVPLYEQSAASFHQDQEFIHTLETTLPPHAMIFQLPYVPSPDSSHDLDYQNLRGYLHSNTLRWSYGAIKGRPTAAWQQELFSGNLSMPTIISRLKQAGFSGIYLDRIYRYPAASEAGLQQALQTTPLVSPNGRFVFFPLPPTPSATAPP